MAQLTILCSAGAEITGLEIYSVELFEFTEGTNFTICGNLDFWYSRQNYMYFQLTAISRDTIILPTEYKHCALGIQLGLMRAIKSRANRFKIYSGHSPFIISYPISLCSLGYILAFRE